MRNGRKLLKNFVSILLFLCVLVLVPVGMVCPQEKPLRVAVEVMAPCVMTSWCFRISILAYQRIFAPA
jgi:hypothetical protein